MHLKNIQPNATRMRRMLESIRAKGITDPKVLEAMSRVPRELFLPHALGAEAYDDNALPIGEKQTISQPTVVAEMTAGLQLTGAEKVLEIGTGCGYQTAILCRLSKRVFTIERHPRLSTSAVERLHAMGYTNFAALVGDGTMGWPQQAPFDAIIVTAAGPSIPPALISQLKPGGKLVIPVGEASTQKLVRLTKAESGQTFEQVLGRVSFVPLIGQQGVKAS
ncbi:MAG TPA: protein-L-isoaspartate(D-aspartate) O-methyltransferase [Alphaproteobacteria bacterium]|nr:protein-L-isoaspartate(D-aspartate) O-methyltransferase [Alphaproteobacteria bacterium]